MRMKTLFAAAAIALSGAVSAQAATINLETSAANNGSTVTPLVTGNNLDITFDWAKTPVTGYQIFTVSSAFELLLTAYNVVAATGTGVQTSGWVLKVWENGAWTNLTTSTTNCNTAGYQLVKGNCDHIASNDYNGNVAATKPGNALTPGGQSSFGPGKYLIGLYDSMDPRAANATIRVAAVPLPATGLALIAGLGGLAALGARRRRAQA